ncbi:hypothetical protein A1Q2_04213 [Trichosporon asahii var. asahii CBS 8904]|uniref:Uncharacterized protein n=1 Tax=Trichosporon asahii var. asahii (strain CBS 8904) TaxID=1220162 RepID=K1VL84_TRIAC|nr:hypothetical protein A1Q2_04213 [Trichosporon asahii var. asahii CBS 8904]
MLLATLDATTIVRRLFTRAGTSARCPLAQVNQQAPPPLPVEGGGEEGHTRAAPRSLGVANRARLPRPPHSAGGEAAHRRGQEGGEGDAQAEASLAAEVPANVAPDVVAPDRWVGGGKEHG